jgi:hypothetical protein
MFLLLVAIGLATFRPYSCAAFQRATAIAIATATTCAAAAWLSDLQLILEVCAHKQALTGQSTTNIRKVNMGKKWTISRRQKRWQPGSIPN